MKPQEQAVPFYHELHQELNRQEKRMANPYLDQLELAIGDVEGILDDGVITPGEWIPLAAKLVPRVNAIMAEAAVWNDEDTKNVLDASDAIYDKYVKPVDIPLVPEGLEESSVDPALKWLARWTLSRAMSRFIKNGLVG